MTKKFYAVKKGLTPGIYENWDDCKAQVDGFPKAEYKGFQTLSDAEEWMGISHADYAASGKKFEKEKPSGKLAGDQRPKPKDSQAIAYVDGSYNQAIARFSYGVVFFIGQEELHFSKSFRNPELLQMRNVAGEIMGAGQAMKEARERGCKELLIYHDYEGIAKWCTGKWKATKEWTKAYKRFFDEVSADVTVTFQKVKAHSKDHYNDLADQLAKDALGDY